MTTLKAKLGIDNEDEALDRSIVMELIAIAVLICELKLKLTVKASR